MYNDEELLNFGVKCSREPVRADNGKFIYLYRTKNLINGKIYVGVRVCKINDPYKDKYIGSGVHVKRNNELNIDLSNDKYIGSHFINSLIKYGYKNFDKKILFFCTSLVEALKIEKEIVNEVFINSNKTMNKIIGGGLPPVNSGDKNGNFGKFWSDEKKKKLSEKLKKSKHSNGCNNNKSRSGVLFDLINSKEYKFSYLGEIREIVGGIKDISPMKNIIGFQYYAVYSKFEHLTIEECITKYGKDSAKSALKLIECYKSGITDKEGLKEKTKLGGGYITRFLNNIKDESSKH